MSEIAIQNNSGLEPLGHAILCEPYEPELRTTKIALPDAVRDSARMKEMRAVVVAVGPDAWEDQTQRAKPGDKILISKFSGVIVQGPLDNKMYRICNDEDVFCKITAEDWSQVKLADPLARDRAERKAIGAR